MDEECKKRVNSSFQESDSVGGGHASEMVFVNQSMRSMYDLTQMSKSHDDARRKLHGMVETAKDEISNLVENLSVDDETACDHIPTDGHMHEVCIRNPLTGKAKGVSNANITRHWDNKSRKGKGKGKGKESAEISSSKGAKRKDQSSQNAYNTQEMTYTPSKQDLNFQPSQNPLECPQFPVVYGQNPHFFQKVIQTSVQVVR
ncbi:uncharacterized protein [Primulina eburnea]|uniref:uncharacterized protein isoform X2 n=1 Tax=Primulina eburnea TaxID=1245227 RepID=UPI003C6C2A88